MELLEHLGEDGWPKTVLFRVPYVMFVFDLQGNKVVVRSIIGQSLKQISSFCREHYPYVMDEKPTAVLFACLPVCLFACCPIKLSSVSPRALSIRMMCMVVYPCCMAVGSCLMVILLYYPL